MRRLHPLWRGFWLALALVAVLTICGSTDALAPYRLERKPLALFAAVTAGAFLAALPGRLRKHRAAPEKTSWQKCLAVFLGGLAMPLALGMAGDGSPVFAAMQGSAGAWAFLGTAWLAGLVTARIIGRRVRV